MTKKSEANPSARPTPAWAGMSAKQRAEINSLKAEIRRMQDAEAKYLRAMAEWKEQLSWIRARLDQMERFLPSTTQEVAVERRLKAHHARSGSH
jgi:Tfp pilus assembly protein PilO